MDYLLLVSIYGNHIIFAHDLWHSQIEYLSNSIDLNIKDRAKPPARRGCSAYASESDTTNLQSSFVNLQFPDTAGSSLRYDRLSLSGLGYRFE